MFQKSVIKNFKQDEVLVATRWAEYQKYLAKIEFIKTVKEEKYQDGFLTDIFENCLGYTKDSTDPSNFNLSREQKNETDSKKADGVIYVNGEIVGVIELKAQNTKDLNKVQQQAFWYLTQHSKAKYVIISNFDKLRFYFDKSTAYEEFSLFTLTYEQFAKLHLILSYESIKDDTPIKIKNKSITFEQDISKQLYKDYSTFRNHLFENIVQNNSDKDKSLLLRLTQKLCDRIIFILFAEDRDLLTPNTIKQIRDRHSNDIVGLSMYEYFKIYFNGIDKGNDKLKISKFNGGLFATDEQLDSLIIDDDVLNLEAQKLSDYDFQSDISVNILGHIFEQSLTDLEEIQANIDNVNFDNKKSKRKKDGVFYTPEYITKYIVDNTLGKLCDIKKDELNLQNIELPKTQGKLLKSEQKILKNLYSYREYLSNLKILDPACGSGAFLNQALEFLISEHSYIDEYRKAYEDEGLSLYDMKSDILKNNLYGVDINEDAVEIAKLSLWIRTATPQSELIRLADKIVCANSLLDMPFEEGSFDVVIGNPPYGAKFSKEDKNILKIRYEKIYKGKYDSYHFFMQLSIELLKEDGLLGYIIPDTWTILQQTEKLRQFILEHHIEILEKYNFNVFEDANIDTITIIITNNKIINEKIEVNIVDKDLNKDISYISQQRFLKNDGYVFNFQINEIEVNLLKKIKEDKYQIKDFCEWSQGLIPYDKYTGMSKEMIKNRVYHLDYKKDDTYKMEIAGKDISKYQLEWNGKVWISYGKWLASPRKQKFFTNPRFLVQRIRNPKLKTRIVATYTEDEYYNNPALSNFLALDNSSIDLKFILSILNSNMINWVYTKSFTDVNIKPTDLEKLPIPHISKEEQEPFINLVDNILIAKEKIIKYNKHFESLNAVDKIEIKEEIEKLEIIVNDSIEQIDKMVYNLYKLTDEEIKIVEGN